MSKRWRLRGRPTYCILVREENMKDPQFPALLNLLLEIRDSKVGNVNISSGRLHCLLSSACIEHLDFSSSFNINDLEIEPFAQLQHNLYENQNFSEMAPPKIKSEDMKDYAVRLFLFEFLKISIKMFFQNLVIYRLANYRFRIGFG